MSRSLRDRLLGLGRRARRRGYTIIEVMMGMAVLAVGASGIVALQKVTVLGVTNGRNINAAAAVAAAHVEAVRADSIMWNSVTDYAEATALVALLPAADTDGGDWMSPAAGRFGLSDLAGETTMAGPPGPVAFCTQMRLTPIAYDPAPGTQRAIDAILLRLEVRTFFAKSGLPVDAECADVGAVSDGLDGTDITVFNPDNYGWVFLTTSIRRNDIVVN